MTKYDIHEYARRNNVAELMQAINMGVNLDQTNRFGSTALMCAIAEKNSDIVAVLLDHGADVTIQNRDGATALHYAADFNMLEVADMLLKKNPQVISISDKHGNQPLWTAAFNAKGNYDFVTLLLRYGADPEHRNRVDLSPLDIPKRKGDDALLQLLESKIRRSK